ncbi:MAG: TolC family protein [Candidatus Riflebacteria bacterium]|nr:TolC family protein [Candidatus Riflebacteria bacterium]
MFFIRLSSKWDIFILSLFFSISFFSTGLALTLSEALEIVASHPSILTKQIIEKQARAASEDAGKRLSDKLLFESEDFSGTLPGFSRSQTTLTFQRPLLDRKKVDSARTLALTSIKSTQLDTERTSWEVSNAVQTTFHEVLVLHNLLNVTEEGVSLAKKLLELTKTRSEAGAVPESEVLKAELELNRSLTENRKLEGQMEQGKKALIREMGLESLESFDVVGTLTPDISLPKEGVLSDSLLKFYPELRQLQIDKSIAQAKAAHLKTINRPGYSIAGSIRDYRETNDVGFVVGFEVELPNKKANSGERLAIAMEGDRIENEKIRLHNELKNSLKESLTRFETNRHIALNLRDKILPSSKQILELALEAYRLGKTNQLLVLDAQKAVIQNRRDYFEALGQMYSALDNMEKLCGVCLVNEKHGE